MPVIDATDWMVCGPTTTERMKQMSSVMRHLLNPQLTEASERYVMGSAVDPGQREGLRRNAITGVLKVTMNIPLNPVNKDG